MEGWVDVGVVIYQDRLPVRRQSPILIAIWLGVEPTTSQSQVQRPNRYTTRPCYNTWTPTIVNCLVIAIRLMSFSVVVKCRSLLLKLRLQHHRQWYSIYSWYYHSPIVAEWLIIYLIRQKCIVVCCVSIGDSSHSYWRFCIFSRAEANTSQCFVNFAFGILNITY